MTPAAPLQLSLPGAEELFAAAGLDTLPVGAFDLKPRQLRFAVALLNCGNQRQAAREAGYSEENAEKLRKNTAVSRFINAAVKTVAQNGDQLVRRKWELSVSLHSELMEIRGKAKAERTDADLKRERELVRMLDRTDTLLAAMLNRLGVKLSGEMNVNHTATGAADYVVLPPEALAGLAQARQEVAATNRLVAAMAARGGQN